MLMYQDWMKEIPIIVNSKNTNNSNKGNQK